VGVASAASLAGFVNCDVRSATPSGGIAGFVQELSCVKNRAASVSVGAAGSGCRYAVHTSFGDRNRLKSSTSADVRPSNTRTLTALARLVVFTTDRYVL